MPCSGATDAAIAVLQPPQAIPAGARKSTFILTPKRGGGAKVLFALLSHKKVTKRLWPAASYGKIRVVGYRLFTGKGRVIL